MQHALVQNGQIVRTESFEDNPPVLSEAKGMRWLELVETSQPKYDPMTHAIAPADPVILDGKCTTQWTAVALPPEGVAANQSAQTQQIADDALRDTAKADALIIYLLTHSAAEIEKKVNKDVTTLVTAKTMLAKLALAVGVLARRELR